MPDVGRPKKVRYIQNMPKILQFSPRGKPGRPEEVELALDQFEAFKLSDYQKFSQADGSRVMQISRPSFGRLLREARFRLADAIVNGKIIKIRLGDAQVGVRKASLTAGNFREVLKSFEERHKKVAGKNGVNHRDTGIVGQAFKTNSQSLTIIEVGQ